MTALPAAPSRGVDSRIENLDARLRLLEASSTNSPSFWKRAWAIFGHSIAITGLFYGALFVLAAIITAAQQ